MGSGGSAPPPPVIVPPNIDKNKLLFSTQIYEIVDLICEGPIVGFLDENRIPVTGVDVAKAIYLNDSPIKNTDDDSINFQKYAFDYRLGSESQEPLSVPDDVERETSYRTPLIGGWDWTSNETLDARPKGKKIITYGAWDESNIGADIIPNSDPIPVIHVIENSFIDNVTVNIFIDHLFDTIHTHKTASKVGGKIESTIDLEVKVYRKLKDGTRTLFETVPINVSGLVESNYGISKDITLPEREDGVSIVLEVRRITKESLSPLLKKKATLDSIVERVSSLRMSYPLSCVVGLKIDARTFTSPPQRSFLIRGKEIRIPSNYFPTNEIGKDQRYWEIEDGAFTAAQIYVGEWDGTFKWGWTNNPVWILYDLITNPVYGLGNYVDSKLIDKWNLYEIGRYADAVDDAGYFVGVTTVTAGLEPRYTCNLIIENQTNAFEIINFIAGVFRGMVYWSNGTLHFADDRPKDAIDHFGNANVSNGEFRYSETAKNARFTVAEVAYNDKDDNYLPKVEYVEDSDGITTLGIIKKSTQGIGTTSRSEARRIGLYQLLSSRLEPEFVSFTTTSKAIGLRPGDVIEISDELRQIKKANGIAQKFTYNSTGNYLEILLDSEVPSGDFLNISLTSPWETQDLSDFETIAAEEGGVPKYKVLDARTKQFTSFPIDYLSSDRRRIRIDGDIEFYNASLPTSGDIEAAGEAIPVTVKTVSGNYMDFPPYSLYTLSGSGVFPEKYKIASITEEDSFNYNITATKYDDRKFELIEDETALIDLSSSYVTPDFSFFTRPNPVRNLAITTGNIIGVFFDMTLSFEAPNTPPSLAMGASLGEPEPYRIQFKKPDNSTYIYYTDTTGITIPSMEYGGQYTFSVTSVGSSPQFLQSNSVSASTFIFPSILDYDQFFVTGVSITNSYSSSLGSTSGSAVLSKPNFEIGWNLLAPDSTILSGVQITESPYVISQDVRFYNSSGQLVPSLTRSGYSSSKLTYTFDEMVAASGMTIRDFDVQISVSGQLAPDPSPTSYSLSFTKNTPNLSSVILTHGSGTDLWTGGGAASYYDSDIISGKILARTHLNNSGWGDLDVVNVYTGSSPSFSVGTGSFHQFIEFNGGYEYVDFTISNLEQQVDVSGEFETQALYNPVYFKMVPEDSVGTGAAYGSVSGYWLVDEGDLTADDINEAIAYDMDEYYDIDNPVPSDNVLSQISLSSIKTKRRSLYDPFDRNENSLEKWRFISNSGVILQSFETGSQSISRRGLKEFGVSGTSGTRYAQICHPNAVFGGESLTGRSETIICSAYHNNPTGAEFFCGLSTMSGQLSGVSKFGFIFDKKNANKNILITGVGGGVNGIDTSISISGFSTRWSMQADYSGASSQSGTFKIWSGNVNVFNQSLSFGGITGLSVCPMVTVGGSGTVSVYIDDLFMSEDSNVAYST